MASKGQTGPDPLGCARPWVLRLCCYPADLSCLPNPLTLTVTEAAAPRGHLLVAALAPSPLLLVLSLRSSNKAHGSYVMCSENLPFVPTQVGFQPSFSEATEKVFIAMVSGGRRVRRGLSPRHPTPNASFIHPEDYRGMGGQPQMPRYPA